MKNIKRKKNIQANYRKGLKMKIGRLMRNNEGRYALDKSVITWGTAFEVYIMGYWIPGIADHNGADYFFMTNDKISISLKQNMIARFKDN